jgi:hypothetical protein
MHAFIDEVVDLGSDPLGHKCTLSGARTTFVPEGPVQGSPARPGSIRVCDPPTMTDWPAFDVFHP